MKIFLRKIGLSLTILPLVVSLSSCSITLNILPPEELHGSETSSSVSENRLEFNGGELLTLSSQEDEIVKIVDNFYFAFSHFNKSEVFDGNKKLVDGKTFYENIRQYTDYDELSERDKEKFDDFVYLYAYNLQSFHGFGLKTDGENISHKVEDFSFNSATVKTTETIGGSSLEKFTYLRKVGDQWRVDCNATAHYFMNNRF